MRYLVASAVCAVMIGWGATALGAQAGDCLGEELTGPDRIAACDSAIAAAAGPAAKAPLLVARATAHRRAGDLEGAAADLEEALGLAPDNADALVELGRVKRDGGDFESALAADDRAIKIDPQSARARLDRMDILARLERYADCLEEAPRALALAPDQPYAYVYRGRCLAGLGKPAEAVTDYEKAAALGLEDSFLDADLAFAYLQLDRAEDALEAARQAISRDPANEYGQYAVIDALLDLDRPDEAIAAYHAGLDAVDADTLGLANLVSWGLYLKGHAADARPIMAAWFAAHPTPGAEAAYEADTYAHILSALGDKDKAVEMFLLASDLGGEPKQSAYRDALATLSIPVSSGRSGLEAGFRACVELGGKCRLGD